MAPDQLRSPVRQPMNGVKQGSRAPSESALGSLREAEQGHPNAAHAEQAGPEKRWTVGCHYHVFRFSTSETRRLTMGKCDWRPVPR